MSEARQDSNQRQHVNTELLMEALQTKNIENFRAEFLGFHPYDQAAFFKELNEDERLSMYHYLSPEEMADLFENLEGENDEYRDVLAEMTPAYAADMLSNMFADDA